MNGNFTYSAILRNGIKLTSEQENEIAAIQLAEDEHIKSRVNLQHQLRLELLELMQKDEFDKSKARKISEKLTRLEKDNVESKRFAINKIVSLLTPEQCNSLGSSHRKGYRHAFISCATAMTGFA